MCSCMVCVCVCVGAVCMLRMGDAGRVRQAFITEVQVRETVNIYILNQDIH